MAVPILLSACVSGQQQSLASFATNAAKEEVAAKAAAAAEESEATGGAAATTALAPIRRENGTISGSKAIDRMIAQAADANNIPRDLAFGVVHVESTYNPRARGRGVYGLSQIMPSTARSMGFSGSSEDLLEPATNLRYGMRYLAGAWEKGGRDVCRASMKYKGGHRATTMTRSAASYCGRVRQHMARIAGNPILTDAPVALAANAPATAEVQVAAAQTPASAPAHVPTAAETTRTAAVAVPTPARPSDAATALAATGTASNAAAAAITIAAHPTARPGETRTGPDAASPIAAAMAAAPADTAHAPEPTLSLAEEPAGGPDPARFGG